MRDVRRPGLREPVRVLRVGKRWSRLAQGLPDLQGFGSALMKRVRLRPVSAKRQAVNRERAKVVAQLRIERKGCEGMPLLKAAAHRAETEADRRKYVDALRACNPWQKMLQPHEPLKRSRRSGGLADPERIMLLCDRCADFTEAEVRLSTDAGLLIPSWRAQ